MNILATDAGPVSFGAGNQFGGDEYFINNLSPLDISLPATYDSTNFDGLTNNFRIEDKMFHKVDDASSGLITWVPDSVFVTSPQIVNPDGTTSDSSIQNGVNAAAAGYTVNIESGTYYESNITITKPVTIDGDYTGTDRSAVVVAPAIADAHDDSTWDGATLSNGFVIQSSGVTIRNLTVDGDAGVGGAGSRNFRAGIITDSRIANPVFNDVAVENVAVQNTYRRGIQIYSPGAVGSGNSIVNSQVDGVTLGPGIAVFDADVTIAGSQASNTPSGIEVIYWGAAHPLAIVQGNTLTNVENGIQLAGPAAGSIVGGAGDLGNAITLSGDAADRYGILVRSAQGDVTVQNNSVTAGGDADGIVLFGNGDAAHPALISGNILINTTPAGAVTGISMSDDGTLFPDGDGNPVADQSDYATISGNTITGFSTGIQFAQTGTQSIVATVSDNTIDGNPDTGILAEGGGASAVIDHNTVNRAAFDQQVWGILIEDGATATVTRNAVGPFDGGIRAFDTTGPITIGGTDPADANTVTGSIEGIWMEDASNVTVQNNIVLDSVQGGVQIDTQSGTSTENLVLDNTITNCPDGILLWGVSGNTISGNIISNCVPNAYVSESNGIYLDASNDNTISDNVVSYVRYPGGGGWGIALDSMDEPSSNNVVSGNQISDSDIGIYVSDSADTIGGTGNVLTGNDVGLQIVGGSQVAVLDNTIAGSATGVDVDGSTAMLQNNDLRNNTAIGLLIHDGAVVDAGQTGKLSPSDFTGLGISTGGNDFSSYTTAASATSGAIVDLNADNSAGPQGVPADATAFGNTWNASLTTPALLAVPSTMTRTITLSRSSITRISLICPSAPIAAPSTKGNWLPSPVPLPTIRKRTS